MKTKTVHLLLTTWLVAAFGVILLGHQHAATAQPAPQDAQGVRYGAWVDTIEFSEDPSPTSVIGRLENNQLDLYTNTISDPALFQTVANSANVVATKHVGTYNELTLNPVGPLFNDGRLNPFSEPAIREALNRLVDRTYITQQLSGGLGTPRIAAIGTAGPDYVRHFPTMSALEAQYSYDATQAASIIATEMAALGATQINGVWHYNGAPVTLIFLIRVEDVRLAIGDYVADQLESIGFVVDRQYVTSSEASPIWLQSDPADGLWHLLTGSWVRTELDRDEGDVFQFFFTPDGLPFPLWQAYDPTPAFLDAANRLASRDYADLNERAELMNDALAWSLEDSVHVFLNDRAPFLPRGADTAISTHLVGNFNNNDLWPYTLRFIGQEGGAMRVAQPSVLVAPWNPVAGTNWVFDGISQSALQDSGVVIDPYNGLARPQRLESAQVYVQSGLPVTRTLDWMTLTVSPTIVVPDDAWVDWDATAQVWRTAGEVYPQPQTALVKSVVTYPADFFSTVTWHDGSSISVADFVMALIFPFDAADPASPIYDASLVPDHDAFLNTFKGYRITATDPLVIEYYTDDWKLDAELNANPLWPHYGRAEAPWHVMGVSFLASATDEVAFSSDKANTLQIPWLDLLSQPSVGILDNQLSAAQASDYVPYAPTLGAFLTPAEVTARWAALQSWRGTRAHYWIGTGPFELATASAANGTLTLERFSAFPDVAGRWDAYAHVPGPATLAVNYESGAPGSAFNITGSGFPINQGAAISVNGQELGTVLVEESGGFTVTLQTSGTAEEGFYLPLAVVNPAATTRFQIDALAPVRPPEGDYVAFDVPDGIAVTEFIQLPIIIR